MRSSFLASLAALAALVAPAASVYNFTADTVGLQLEELANPYGLLYNLTSSQYQHVGKIDSWWSTSFITGTNGNQYVLLSQCIALPYFKAYRASIFNVETHSYRQFSVAPTETGDLSQSSLSLVFPDWYFGQTTGDALGPIRTWSNRTDVNFDLTFEMTSPIIFDGGLGPFDWDGGNYEWSMPAGTTTGRFVMDNETVEIDPSNSLTWYDRQWSQQYALSQSKLNWTWFEMHLWNAGPQGEKCRLSQWFAEYPLDAGGDREYAWGTMMCAAGVNILQPAKPLVRLGRYWKSPNSNFTYALSWQVTLVDGTTLVLETAADDQELHSPNNSLYTYEGFLTINGTSSTGRPITGWGLVEMETFRME